MKTPFFFVFLITLLLYKPFASFLILPADQNKNPLKESIVKSKEDMRNIEFPSVGDFYNTSDGGIWFYDSSDTISSDNEGTVLVNIWGKRFKRLYDSAKGVNIEWFGGSGDGKTDNGPAFEKAKAALPNGGIINFGKGIYNSDKRWLVNKSDIFIKGLGADKTILTADSSSTRTFDLCPIREADSLFIQGVRGDARQYFPFKNETKKGDQFIELKDASWAKEFPISQEIFIRAGASYYDQEFGELNTIVRKEGAKLYLQYPLSRDYSYEAENWNGTLLQSFKPSHTGDTAIAVIQNPPKRINYPFSIGNDIYTLKAVNGNMVSLLNPGRDNSANTYLPGTHVAKGRQVIKSFHTQSFRMEGVTIKGQQARVFSADNSTHTYLKNCIISRNISPTKGGYIFTIDCARDVVFDHVVVTAPDSNPSWSQISRSSGDVTFKGCTFKNVSTDFSEFCFHVLVDSCKYDIKGSMYAFRLGKSTTQCTVKNTEVVMSGGQQIISMDDIQGFKNSQREGSTVDHCTFLLNNAGSVLQNMGKGKNIFSNNIVIGSTNIVCNTLRIKKSEADALSLPQLYINNNIFKIAVKSFLFNAGDAEISNNKFINIDNNLVTTHGLGGVLIWKAKEVSEADLSRLIFKNNEFVNWPVRKDKFQISEQKNLSAIIISNNSFK